MNSRNSASDKASPNAWAVNAISRASMYPLLSLSKMRNASRRAWFPDAKMQHVSNSNPTISLGYTWKVDYFYQFSSKLDNTIFDQGRLHISKLLRILHGMMLMTVFCISGEVFDDDLQAWYSFLGISKYAYSAHHTLG